MKLLRPVEGIDVIRRGVYEVDHAGHSYAVEVDYLDFSEKVRLYKDGQLVTTEKSPATFAVCGGAIKASMGLLGMKTATLVADNRERQLRPARGTAEARRATLAQRHPTVSKLVAVLAWVVLLAALVIDIPELISLLGDVFGFDFDSPFGLPGPVMTLIGLLALLAAVDRALRFKHSRWLG